LKLDASWRKIGYMRINVKKTDHLVVPERNTTVSAGYDVVALSEPEIVGDKVGDMWSSIDYIQYRTGLFIAPEDDNYGQNYHTLVMPRSSLSKYNLVLCNSIALIDNDYRGEILLRFKYIWQPSNYSVIVNPNLQMTNGDSIEKIDGDNAKLKFNLVGTIDKSKIYKKGDAIGQIVAEVTNPIDWMVVADLKETLRGAGGFGSREEKLKSIQPKIEDGDIVQQWNERINKDVSPHATYEMAVKNREKSAGLS
jgi:dUTPase